MNSFDEEMLGLARKNWGRWGPDDEIGALNFLTSEQILVAIRTVRQGKVFTLGLPIGRKGGDLLDTGNRLTTVHLMTHDEGTYRSGKDRAGPGEFKWADDAVFMYLQGTTHLDALGHAWFGDKIYNGYSSETGVGGLSKASVQPLAQRGIVGRGVLYDVPRYKGVRRLSKGEPISLDDLMGTAKMQGVEPKKHDVVLVRTGYNTIFYEDGPDAYYKDMKEPGIAYSKELAEWFHAMEVSAYGSDTIGAEEYPPSKTTNQGPMHILLLHGMGITIAEMLWLEDLANDCSRDKQYDFLYVCSPLKFIGGTGSPINPLAVK